jgi:phosphate acetyltransferase
VARTLYVTAAGPDSGKSVVALGLFEAMSRRVGRVAAFRPVVRTPSAGPPTDPLLSLLGRRYGIDPQLSWGVTYADLYADPAAAMGTIVERFHAVERDADAVLVVGSDFQDTSASGEPSFNARIAANLGAPVLLVVDGRVGSDAADVATSARLARSGLVEHGCTVLGVIANRVPAGRADGVRAALGEGAGVLPEAPVLSAPTVAQVLAATSGRPLIGGRERLEEEVLGYVVAAMTLPHVLEHLTQSALVLVPGDRGEVLVGVITAHRSRTFPRLAGVLLTGGLEPEPVVRRLVDGLGTQLPVAVTDHPTFDAATLASRTHGDLTDGSAHKVSTALALVQDHVDTGALLDRLDLTRSETVTPLMFEHDLAEKARADRRRIVLPEGTEPRVLKAAGAVLARGVADVVLLGDPVTVAAAAEQAGADISDATVLDPAEETLRHRLATEYAARRAHKGVTYDTALDVVVDVSYAGTLLVELGEADGMVSGAAHTTAHTIRPAFEIIRTVPGTSIVSSVFFMCLADRVLVFGDCAVNPDPTAEQLADIAISSATTAAAFGVEPRVAMLSYSTGDSGRGADVDKVRRATDLVRQLAPQLQVEGPIQYDAATDAGVAATKLPGSAVAGRATVLIFPDLNTGNNTYKAVQRAAGALAVGPVLQGLRKPVNDLSRGATVDDIVTTIAITAVQAQQLAARQAATTTGVAG